MPMGNTPSFSAQIAATRIRTRAAWLREVRPIGPNDWSELTCPGCGAQHVLMFILFRAPACVTLCVSCIRALHRKVAHASELGR